MKTLLTLLLVLASAPAFAAVNSPLMKPTPSCAHHPSIIWWRNEIGRNDLATFLATTNLIAADERYEHAYHPALRSTNREDIVDSALLVVPVARDGTDSWIAKAIRTDTIYSFVEGSPREEVQYFERYFRIVLANTPCKLSLRVMEPTWRRIKND